MIQNYKDAQLVVLAARTRAVSSAALRKLSRIYEYLDWMQYQSRETN